MTFLGLDSNGWVAMATFVIALATFIAAMVTTYSSRKIFEKSSKDAWLKTYQTHYLDFWHDEDIRNVRMWIVNNEAYETIKGILIKRLNRPETISKEEYLQIDKIDKFVNTITLIRQINPRLSGDEQIWEELFLKYWLTSPKRMERTEMIEYVKLCYTSTYYLIMESEWAKS